MTIKVKVITSLAILLFILLGVSSNIMEQRAVDKSKLPEKVELSKGFQRWITNLKNKKLNIEADEFRLADDTQLYNSKWTTISSIEDTGKLEEFETILAEHKEIKKYVVFSPSKREFLDYRNIERYGYKPNEVRFYGQKEDKIVDTKLLDCSVEANCFFDRGYFINNDLLVVSEISRNIDKKDKTPVPCTMQEVCEYTIKIHVIDMINNNKLTYISKPFGTVLETLIPQL